MRGGKTSAVSFFTEKFRGNLQDTQHVRFVNHFDFSLCVINILDVLFSFEGGNSLGKLNFNYFHTCKSLGMRS